MAVQNPKGAGGRVHDSGVRFQVRKQAEREGDGEGVVEQAGEQHGLGELVQLQPEMAGLDFAEDKREEEPRGGRSLREIDRNVELEIFQEKHSNRVEDILLLA